MIQLITFYIIAGTLGIVFILKALDYLLYGALLLFLSIMAPRAAKHAAMMEKGEG